MPCARFASTSAFPIEFPEFPDGLPTDPSLGAKARHCALGEIHYDCVDPGAEKGRLLYIKPILTGDEPADVLNYNSSDPDFPQQSTTDQWFDESQFESYRRLGAHTIEAILGPGKTRLRGIGTLRTGPRVSRPPVARRNLHGRREA